MLPKETQEVVERREEYNFYSNQCIEEMKRVANDNAKLIAENFYQFSQIQCSYINNVNFLKRLTIQSHLTWSDFNTQYSIYSHSNEEKKDTQEFTELVRIHKSLTLKYSQTPKANSRGDTMGGSGETNLMN